MSAKRSRRRELRRAGIAAAREARALLADAMVDLQAPEAPSRDARTLAAEMSKSVAELFAAEVGGEEHVRDRLVAAMRALRKVLGAMHELRATASIDAAGDVIARCLAIVYPARKELERALEETPEDATAPFLLQQADDAPLRPPHEPFSEEGDERRHAPRAVVQADVGVHSETNFYTGFSGDLSSGGLFVATWDPLPIGTELTVSFVLAGGHRITAPGRVAWIRDTARRLDTDAHPGMGVRFTSVAAADREAIEAFLSVRPPLFFEEEG